MKQPDSVKDIAKNPGQYFGQFLGKIDVRRLLFNFLTIFGHIISKARALIPSDFDPNTSILVCLK